MPSILFTAVSFSYSSAHTVFAGVDLSIGPGWTGVVGANGSGKSTLLELAAGVLSPDVGTVSVDSGVAPVLCRQRAGTQDAAVERFAQGHEPDDFVLRGRLALDAGDLDRWDTLSPGERKRWQIGAALAARPDVLLLDEPTNHLDATSRALLLGELHRFRDVGLVVSHDRELLDALTSATMLIDAGSASLWGGSYEHASREWTAAAGAADAAHENEKRELAKAQRKLADRRRSLDARSAAFSRSMRSAAAKDHDAHSTARKARHQGGEAAASKALSVLASERDRLASSVESVDHRRPIGGTVAFRGSAASRPVLVEIVEPVRVGADRMVTHRGLAVERATRVHVAGPNGAGKSTLLSAIAERWDLDAARLLHLPQEFNDEDALALLEDVRHRPPEVRGQILQIVARLGLEPETLLATERPSPGEARKLSMAVGLGTEAWLLILDEPTNHLDLPTVERLEDALLEYPGALVIVSHDRTFAARLTNETWEIRDDRVHTS